MGDLGTPYRRYGFVLLCMVVLAVLATSIPASRAEEGSQGPQANTPDLDADPGAGDEPAEQATRTRETKRINLLTLLVSGGWFMVPIGLLSLLTVTIVVERMLGLRRDRVMPHGLVAGLGQLGGPNGNFDPRAAYKLCQEYPSAAASVIRAMLLKVGRPHSEVEHSVAEASQREAERLHANVRWLNLAAAVAPLLGLLGTVWGMIDAFHGTTKLTPGQNKADYLAEGIYVALVTTLSGLILAIPAAIFAHYFESRIQAMFHRIDELLFNLLPQVERYEGRVRFGRNDSPEDGAGNPPPPPRTSRSPASTS